MVAFYQRQAQELPTITALVTRRTLLGSVLADTDSMAEEQESPRARLDTSSTHLRRRVEIGCKTRVGVKWVEPGFNPLLWCPCERGWAEYETNTIVQSADT